MKILLLIESDSCIREPLISWPEKHLDAVVEHYGPLPGASDMRIERAVQEHRPDVTVYNGTLAVGKPLVSTLARIKDNCRSVFVGWDAGSLDWQPLLKRFREERTFDLVVAVDGSYEACVDVAFPEPKNPDLWEPEYTIAGFPIYWERTCDLGFWGGVSPDDNPRNRLMRQVGDFCEIAYKGDPPRPYSDYIRFIKRCWATLNSAWQGNSTCGYARHVKGRCIEAVLGGSALFEAKGSPLAHWFEPGVDYFEFDEDRPREILDVLRQPDFHAECTLRAGRMAKKVRELYSPDKFWATVIGERQP